MYATVLYFIITGKVHKQVGLTYGRINESFSPLNNFIFNRNNNSRGIHYNKI
jgi:hypothetical protein